MLTNNKNTETQLDSEQNSQNLEDKLVEDQKTTDNTMPATSSTPTTNSNNEEQGQFSGEDDITSPDVAVFEVSYDGTSFTPKTITIKQGDIVVFKNNSNKDFWPASNNHPSHTLYPEFDPKKSIAPGGKFEFKFLKTGTWGFHDHKNDDATGTIIVK